MNQTNVPAHGSARFGGPAFVALALAAGLGLFGLTLWIGPKQSQQGSGLIPIPPPSARNANDSTPTRPLPYPKLSLIGLSRSGNKSVALIAIENQRPEYYAVGQEIRPGTAISAILADHVVLKHGGLTMTLYVTGEIARTPGTASETRYPIATAPADGYVEGYKERNPDIDAESLSRNRTGAAKEFLSDVKLARSRRGGFVVETVEPGSMYDKLGVRAGDVIYSFDTPDTSKIDESFMESVMNQTEMQLEVYRDGNYVLLRHRLDE